MKAWLTIISLVVGTSQWCAVTTKEELECIYNDYLQCNSYCDENDNCASCQQNPSYFTPQ